MRIWTGNGRLRVTACLDGRVLLRLEDGSKSEPWLELASDDVLWLIDALKMAYLTTADVAGCSERSSSAG